jgi:hypothetical protein
MKWKTYEPNKLSAMVESKRPVFVLNTSLFPGGTKGNIIINFVDGTRKRHFTVPDTFIPLCITDSIPADLLLNSPDLLDLLRKRIITLVDSDQAEEYLATPEAKEEYEAIVLSQHSAKARGVDLETATKRTFSSTAALTHEVEEAVSDANISTRVRAKVDELSNGAITGKEFLAECKRHGEGFTEIDLYYIRDNVRDLNVGKWVEAKLFDKSGDLSGSVTKNATKKPTSALGRAIAAKKAAPAKKYKTSLDEGLDNDDDEPSSPEEEAELARGMAAAQANQAIGGKSKVPEMIAKMASGK